MPRPGPLRIGVFRASARFFRPLQRVDGVEHAAPALYSRRYADVAQLVERLLAMQKVEGSSPFIRFENPRKSGVFLFS